MAVNVLTFYMFNKGVHLLVKRILILIQVNPFLQRNHGDIAYVFIF